MELERFLAPGETAKARWKVGGREILLTDKRILIGHGGSVLDIGLNHIASIEVSVSWRVFQIGAIIAVISFILTPGFYPILILALIGLGIAVWGYLNRYRMVISFGPRSYSLRGGKSLVEVASRIRSYVETVRST